MTVYAATTNQITVSVRPFYLDGQSEPLSKKFVFAYAIKIENQRNEQVQLLERHWIIRDSNGNVEQVQGEGVVGRQPILEPGHLHEYNSYCILKTFEGSMEGSYLMKTAENEYFRVNIPRFILRALAN